eukprot:SM000140S00602  [mRNA]  locus=s140:170562:173228:- [translate_table: standard]
MLEPGQPESAVALGQAEAAVAMMDAHGAAAPDAMQTTPLPADDAWPAHDPAAAGAPPAVPPPANGEALEAATTAAALAPAGGGGEEMKSLWVGDLQYWMEETYLWSCFAHASEVHDDEQHLEQRVSRRLCSPLPSLPCLLAVLWHARSTDSCCMHSVAQLASVKIIRNKVTGYSEGYGFIEFATHMAAAAALHALNGTLMPQTEQPFRLNWASFGIGERRPDGANDHSIFVGDLAPDVTDAVLHETFRAAFPSVKGAKVVIDNATGRSKGYGFVRFGAEEERDRALAEMNGQFCSNRPMRISVATPKKTSTVAGSMPSRAPAGIPPYLGAYGPSPAVAPEDPSNTTIFVGGLDPSATEADLRHAFGAYGDLVYVKIPYGKGCGFVQFTHRGNAEEAMRCIHGSTIGSQAVRLSWGRNPATKQQRQQQQAPPAWAPPQMDPYAGYYGYSPQQPAYDLYGGYGGHVMHGMHQGAYGQGHGHPDAYAAAYGSYGGYPQPAPGYEGYAVHVPEPAEPPKEAESGVGLVPSDGDRLSGAFVEGRPTEGQFANRHLWVKNNAGANAGAT